FDENHLAQYGLGHEAVGQHIITHVLGQALCGLRRSPSGAFAAGETLDPQHVAYIMQKKGPYGPAPTQSRQGPYGPVPARQPPVPRQGETGGKLPTAHEVADAAASTTIDGTNAPTQSRQEPDHGQMPRWLLYLKPVLSGMYTADNLDYVLRDAYMCGVAVGPV